MSAVINRMVRRQVMGWVKGNTYAITNPVESDQLKKVDRMKKILPTNSLFFRFFDLEWFWRGILKQAIKGVGYIIITERMPILGS